MNFPWRDGNRVELLINGEEYFPRLFQCIAEARRAGTKAAIAANAVEEDPTRLRMVDSPSSPQLMLDNTLCERDPAQILSPGHIEVFLTAVDEEPSSKQAGGAAGASPDGAERGRRFKVSTPSP